ncbi:uncharacterized protein [Montipora foliosa]|uniref:uncharacterized protein n=1 Tax=Montipora foliosa TaxID=591990 RepID=UPI0035F17EA3
MLPEESFNVADRWVKCSGYFFTLDEGTGENNYRKAKDALNKYFKPQANFPYERLYFREMSQLPSESVEQFVTQVRQKAQSCEFGDAAAVDEQIRDQVISKCLSHNIRRKLLEKGKILTLQQLREIARVMEDSEKQARKIEGAAKEVNRVGENSNEKGNPRVAGKQGTARLKITFVDMTYPKGWTGSSFSVPSFSLDEVEFVVIESEGHALLGRETAIALGVLKLGAQINSLQLSTDGENKEPNILDKFPGCCEGIGKLKDCQLKIPIDAEAQPVAQPVSRVPYHLRDKLTNKLKGLVELDIIEKVSGPSSWVSPVVVVPKPTGDIRLCLDMRQANIAVKRERYPIPTIDEVVQDVNQNKFFIKLDLNSAYQHIGLAPESRDITTFGTHNGLYRYKRLMSSTENKKLRTKNNKINY